MGVQGSLLSVFVEPVYFSSIILGSLYHGDHLSRAMYQRVSNIEDLPPLYALNKPLLSGKYPPPGSCGAAPVPPTPRRSCSAGSGPRAQPGRGRGCLRA